MISEKKPSSFIRQSAMQIKLARRLRKILPAVIGLGASMILTVYVASLLVTQSGSFTINVKDYGDRSYALALSESDSFKKSSSTLSATEALNINNITYTNLPNNLNDINGSHNGENYLAYTFYVKNTGEKECDYKYSLAITRATAGIDAAVRVRIYYNADYYKDETDLFTHSGAFTDYAKPKTGGNGLPEVDPGERTMTNFVSNDVVAEGKMESFRPGDMSKFTVVIWLEGEDPDCTDDVLGGQFKVDMNIEILGDGEA